MLLGAIRPKHATGMSNIMSICASRCGIVHVQISTNWCSHGGLYLYLYVYARGCGWTTLGHVMCVTGDNNNYCLVNAVIWLWVFQAKSCKCFAWFLIALLWLLGLHSDYQFYFYPCLKYAVGYSGKEKDCKKTEEREEEPPEEGSRYQESKGVCRKEIECHCVQDKPSLICIKNDFLNNSCDYNYKHTSFCCWQRVQ